MTLSDPPTGNAEPARRVRVPLFPLHSHARAFLNSVDTFPASIYSEMARQIDELTGTPQSNVDWSDPDRWIQERLVGDAVHLAVAMWKAGLNPRHSRGSWYLSRTYGLLDVSTGTMRVTAAGRDFCIEPSGETVNQIDVEEGLRKVLSIVAEGGPAMRGAFVDDWTEYCHRFSNYRSDVAIRETLRVRLLNLAERGLLARNGNNYEVSTIGLAYLDTIHDDVEGREETAHRQLLHLARQQREEIKGHLLNYLETLEPPRALETIVQRLLTEMGYVNVETTSISHDKGVDVVADIEVGITQIREVVQVKRRQGNIHRTVLDQLRGSLHRFNAWQGTIITTGGFSAGARDAALERGAPPITLIDGSKLIELLIQYRLGIRKQSIELLELDIESLAHQGDPNVD